jgi:hypothetical protein
VPGGDLRLADAAHPGEGVRPAAGRGVQGAGGGARLEAVGLAGEHADLDRPGDRGGRGRVPVVVLVLVDAAGDVARRDGAVGGAQGEGGRRGGAG